MAEVISRNAEGQLAYRTASQWHTIPEGNHTQRVDDELDELERAAALVNLQVERTETVAEITYACQHRIQRKILSTVVLWEGIVMYERLYDCVNTGERNVRKHVGKLADAGILRREGNPAIISLVDTDVSLLVEHQLHATETEIDTETNTEPLDDDHTTTATTTDDEPTTPTPATPAPPSTPPPSSNSEPHHPAE